MKKVLLTGATGFIGRHCFPFLLKRGYKVHAVSTDPVKQIPGDIEWHGGDLLSPGVIPRIMARVKPTHLLHLAWYTEHGKFWASPENLLWVSASLELFKEFALHGGKRIVVAGSCAEYDWNAGMCFEKTTPLRPSSLYGTCKNSLRSILEAFSAESGLSSAWGRIFFLYGPYENPSRLVSSVIRSLLLGEKTRCTSGEQSRDFLFVRDVADAFVSLVNSNVEGPVNISSGQPVAVREVVTMIGDLAGRPELVELGSIPMGKDEVSLLVGDNNRLKKELHWEPKTDLKSGLNETIKWWKDTLRKNKNRSGHETDY